MIKVLNISLSIIPINFTFTFLVVNARLVSQITCLQKEKNTAQGTTIKNKEQARWSTVLTYMLHEQKPFIHDRLEYYTNNALTQG